MVPASSSKKPRLELSPWPGPIFFWSSVFTEDLCVCRPQTLPRRDARAAAGDSAAALAVVAEPELADHAVEVVGLLGQVLENLHGFLGAL